MFSIIYMLLYIFLLICFHVFISYFQFKFVFTIFVNITRFNLSLVLFYLYLVFSYFSVLVFIPVRNVALATK